MLNFLKNLFEKKLGSYKISPIPHGSFSNSTTLTVVSTTTAYPITYDTDEVKSGVTHSTSTNPSRVYVDTSGTYFITFSAIGKSTVANKTLDIWLAVDGVNVARSNTISNFIGTGNERIITVTFIYNLTKDHYFEIMYRGSDTGITIVATGVQASPTRPACPSIILTVNKISK